MERNVDIEAHSRKQIGIGTIVTYLAVIIDIVVGLLFTPWIARQLGQDYYGIFTLSSSVVNIFLIDFGLSSAISKYLSNYKAHNDIKSEQELLGIVVKLYFLIDLILLIIFTAVYLLIPYIYKGLSIEQIPVFRICFVVVATSSLFTFPVTPFNGILNANESFIALKLSTLFQKILYVIFTIVVLIFTKNVIFVVAASAISAIVTAIYKLIYTKVKVKTKINLWFWDKQMAKMVLSFSIWVFIITLSGTIVSSLVPSILGIVSNAREIAIFGFAYSIMTYTYSLSSVVSSMFLPKITRIYETHENPSEEVAKLFIKIGKIQTLLTGTIFFGFIFLGKEFVNIIMGYDYFKSYYCAILLIFPWFFSIPRQIGISAAYAKDLVKPIALIYLICSIICCAMSFLAGYIFGSVGTSLTYAVCLFAETLITDFFVLRKLKMPVGKIFYEGNFIFTIVALLDIVLLYSTTKYLGLNQILLFLVRGFGFVILLAFETVFFVDKDTRLEIMKKIGKKNGKYKE